MLFQELKRTFRDRKQITALPLPGLSVIKEYSFYCYKILNKMTSSERINRSSFFTLNQDYLQKTAPGKLLHNVEVSRFQTLSGGSKTFQPASQQMRYWLLVVRKKQHSGLYEEQTGDSHAKYQERINCLILIRAFNCY